MRSDRSMWFVIVLILVVGLLMTSAQRPSPAPYAPYAPQPQHGVLGNIAGWVVDLFVGHRIFREAAASDYQVRACQIENLDPPSRESDVISNQRGW